MLKENTNMNFNDKIKNVHIPLVVIVWTTKRPWEGLVHWLGCPVMVNKLSYLLFIDNKYLKTTR